jgi:glycosyltransferase involved in cell wall biosynthesis
VTPKLSILICSTLDRDLVLNRLLDYFEVQKKYLDNPEDVEILTNIDNKEKSIGQKRNELVKEAKGEYVVAFDSDDLPSPTYLFSILKAIEQKPDVVGLKMIMITDGVLAEQSWHSLQFKEWATYEDPIEKGKRFFVRNPHHLCPTRRELAIQVPYPEISMGEDHDYSKRLLPLLEKEVMPQEVLYYYLFNSRK